MLARGMLAIDYDCLVSDQDLTEDDSAVESESKALDAPRSIALGFVLAAPLWAIIGWVAYVLVV